MSGISTDQFNQVALQPLIHCREHMDKIGWEGQPISDQVKVTWKCWRCKTVIERFVSTIDGKHRDRVTHDR